MAILHHKEEKIQVVLGRLPKEYTHEQFVEMFIKLYSKDWGKIKAAYIKQSQDKEPGTIINMPKPDLYLKQLLETYIAANAAKTELLKEKTVETKVKAIVKKKEVITTEKQGIKKPKTVGEKKVVEKTAKPIAATKKKVPSKKKVEEIITPAKTKKVKSTEK